MQLPISKLLRLSGALTCGAALLFLIPAPLLQLAGARIEGEYAMFFVRHWGLVTACLGGLLVHAATRPALQAPAMWAATLEKLALVLMVASTPALAALRPAAVMDGACVLFYSAVLLRRDK